MTKSRDSLIAALLALCSVAVFLLVDTSLRKLEGPQLSFLPRPTPARNISGISFDGASLWMTVDGERAIYQVDPASWEVKREIEFPVEATGGSAWDGGFLWQLAYEEKKLYQIDLNTNRILKTIPSPGSGQCSGTTYDGNYLWVANFEDKKIYQIDQNDGGKILQTLEGYFEATGLAWDGKCLWNGILVGTISHDEQTPYTGFVQQRDLETKETRVVYHIPGVGPGTSNWTPSNEQANLFWWYDGFNNRIIQVQTERNSASGIRLMAGAFLLLTLIPMGLMWRRGTVPAAKNNTAGGES